MQAAVIAVVLGLLGAAVAQAEECRPETIGSFPAGAVIDGRTFKLDDGRAVRLAAIEVPPGDAAKAALEKLVAGSRVTLKVVPVNPLVITSRSFHGFPLSS